MADHLDVTRSNTTENTISGVNNEIATRNSEVTTSAIFSDVERSSGKFYAEWDTSGGSSTVVGIATQDHINTLRVGFSAYSWGLMSAGRLYHDGSYTAVSGFLPGDRMGLAVDTDTGEVWISQNGGWMSGHPELGTDPSFTDPDIAAATGIAIAATMRNIGDVFKLNVLGEELRSIAPGGFSAWMDGGADQTSGVFAGNDYDKLMVTESSVYSASYDGQRAFNGDSSNRFISAAATYGTDGLPTGSPEWLQWDLGAGLLKILTEVSFLRSTDNSFPQDITVYGSDTGTFTGEETDLGSTTINDAADASWSDSFAFNASEEEFRYYRIAFDTIHYAGNDRVEVAGTTFVEVVASAPTFDISLVPEGQKIALTVSAQSTEQTDFPVLINLASDSGITDFDCAAIFADLGANSKKLAVEIGDTGVQVPVEIEHWDTDNAQLWIKIPVLSATEATILNFYYDSTQPDNVDYVGDVGEAVAQDVWSNDFATVIHPQDPAGTIYNSVDGAVLTPLGGLSIADDVLGRVFVSANDGDCLPVAGAARITGSGTMEVICQAPAAAQYDGSLCAGNLKLTGDLSMIAWTATEMRYWSQGASSNLPLTVDMAGRLNHLAIVFDPTNVTHYDLTGDTSNTQAAAGNEGISADLCMGRWDSQAGRTMKGNYRGVRTSTVARSADWLGIASLSDTDTLITFSSGPALDYWDETTSNLTLFALSGDNNEVATRITTDSSFACNVKAAIGHSTGKKYFEVDIEDADLSIYYSVIGFTLAGYSDALYPGDTTNSWGWMGNDRCYHEDVNVGSVLDLAPLGVGDVTMGLLIDIDAGKAWIVRDGIAYGRTTGVISNADIEAGTDHCFESANFAGVEIFPALSLYRLAHSATLKLTAAEQSYSNLPAEYTAWGDGGSIPAPVTTKHLAFADMAYGDLSQLLAAMDMPYGDAVARLLAAMVMSYSTFFSRSAFVGMPYGIKLGMTMAMYYGDAQTLIRIVNQYYGDAQGLMRTIQMKYGDLFMLQKTTEMPYRILKSLQVIMEARYGINEASLQAIMEQNYSLSEYNLLCKKLNMPYLLQEGDNLSHVSAGVTINGITVNPSHVNIEYSLDSFVASGEIHLSKESEYIVIHKGDDFEISMSGDTHVLVVESEPRRTRSSVVDTKYIIEGASPAIRLSTPWCDTFTCVFEPDTAQNIFEALADPIPVDWQVVNFPVLKDTLYANDEDKISVMRKLTKSVGAIIQSNPDGSLRVIYSYPLAVPAWSTSSPDYFLTDSVNFVSQDESFVHNHGYNRYSVSSTATPEERIWLEQDDYPNVLAFEVPWENSEMTLEHSGGAGVAIPEYIGIIEETFPSLDEPSELVEFVAGFANLQRSWYGTVEFEWIREPLGAVTYSEDGQLEAELKTGSTDGYSLARIRYTSRYKLWRVDNGSERDVQYILRVMDDEPDSSESCS